MMKEVMKDYFRRQRAYCERVFGGPPTVMYDDDLPGALLCSEPDEDGEVEWVPIVQETPLNWSALEAELGFPVHEELKAYYGAYFFLQMTGRLKDMVLYFTPITDEKALPGILSQYLTLRGRQMFLLGMAVIAGRDDYLLLCDNTTGAVSCYEEETKTSVSLPVLREVIAEMEAVD
jgi:hypothetical protein